MLGGILALICFGFISFTIIERIKKRFPFTDARFLKNLFFYHVLLSIAYYVYALLNPSDSVYYYQKVIGNHRGETWMDFYGTSTTFIEFFGYPFIKYLYFSYESVMVLFSFLGFLGFVYFYIFFRENIRFRHRFLNFDLLTIIFLLPNLHFWSASFGKGSIIFFGLGLFFFGISKIRKRLIPIIIGGIIIYHVRPHVMLVILVSTAIGFVFSTRNIRIAWRAFVLIAATVAFFFIYQDVLTMVGIDEEEFVSQGLDLTKRANELMNATSAVDITSYNLPMQVFTFLYRPLFFDSPGFLGFIVSIENVFYLLITLKMFSSWKGFKYLFSGNFLSKTAFLSFITISIALAQVSGNLGLAIRQKSQVMILFMFVIIAFLDDQKFARWKVMQKRKKLMERLKQNLGREKSVVGRES